MFEIKCNATIRGVTREFASACETQPEAAELINMMVERFVLMHLLQGHLLVPVDFVATETTYRLEMQSECECVSVVFIATEIDTQHLH